MKKTFWDAAKWTVVALVCFAVNVDALQTNEIRASGTLLLNTTNGNILAAAGTNFNAPLIKQGGMALNTTINKLITYNTNITWLRTNATQQEAKINLKVNIAGDTMTGDLKLNSKSLNFTNMRISNDQLLSANSISFKASGNTAQYYQLKTVTSVPWLYLVGTTNQVLKTDTGDTTATKDSIYTTISGAGSMNTYYANNADYLLLGQFNATYTSLGSAFSGNSFVRSSKNILFVSQADTTNYITFQGATGTATSFAPGVTNTIDLGTTGSRWKSGYIKNAWTVGDLVFNYAGSNYRILEAEKITNGKLHGLMYVMDGTAVMWIEPNGKLHTTQTIDTEWEGITGLTFDEDGGVYKDEKVVRYPEYGEGNLPSTYEDNKEVYSGDTNIERVNLKPIKQVII